MSSPLLDEIRERRGLAYHVSCSADVTELSGQLVIEASTAPEHAEEFMVEMKRLLLQQGDKVDATGLERAKNLIAVRRLRDWERTARRLEDAVLDVFALGRVRSRAEVAAHIDAVGPARGAARVRPHARGTADGRDRRQAEEGPAREGAGAVRRALNGARPGVDPRVCPLAIRDRAGQRSDLQARGKRAGVHVST